MNRVRASIAQSLAKAFGPKRVDAFSSLMKESSYDKLSERVKIEQEASAFFASMARAAMGLVDDAGVTVKTVKVPECFEKHLSIKTAFASNMTRGDVSNLMFWCDFQCESLWDGMSTQEILNVYRASAEWETWEGWAEEDFDSARKAWNEAVIDPGNEMLPRN